MNYNEIVNRFKEIVEDHKMLVDFGYGQISDIKTRSEGDGESEGADYPYLFLNPGVHNREQSVVTYNFNMIIMDMAREEEASEYQNFLNIQSNCIQYCDDVIARLYYHYKDKPEISFTVSYTPFYERFQDQLAGATATISIEVPNNIDECIAPFYVGLAVDAKSNSDQLFRPDVAQSPLAFPVTILDTYSGMRPVYGNYYRIEEAGEWTFVVEGVIRRTEDTDVFPDSLDITVVSKSGSVIFRSSGVGNWPINPPINADVPFKIEYNAGFLDPDTSTNLTSAAEVTWVSLNDPATEDRYLILSGCSMKGYIQA